jgi:hypothetical protein
MASDNGERKQNPEPIPPNDLYKAGWVKVPRLMFAHAWFPEVGARAYTKFEAYCYLLQLARYKPYAHVDRRRGVKVPLEIGQFVMSLSLMAKQFGWEQRAVQWWVGSRAFRELFTVHSTSPSGTVYSVVNYDDTSTESDPNVTGNGTPNVRDDANRGTENVTDSGNRYKQEAIKPGESSSKQVKQGSSSTTTSTKTGFSEKNPPNSSWKNSERVLSQKNPSPAPTSSFRKNPPVKFDWALERYRNSVATSEQVTDEHFANYVYPHILAMDRTQRGTEFFFKRHRETMMSVKPEQKAKSAEIFAATIKRKARRA